MRIEHVPVHRNVLTYIGRIGQRHKDINVTRVILPDKDWPVTSQWNPICIVIDCVLIIKSSVKRILPRQISVGSRVA